MVNARRDARHAIGEHAKRAFFAWGNLGIGGAAALASIAVGNPLPLIFWGLGSGMWTVKAITSRRYLPAIMEEERAEARATASRERDTLAQRITAALGMAPFCRWVEQRSIPDYAAEHTALTEMRDRIARIARDRNEVNTDVEGDIVARLDTMRTAHLKFVASRIAYLQMLTGQRMAQDETPAPSLQPAAAPSAFTRFIGVFVDDGTARPDQPRDSLVPRGWRTEQERHGRDDSGRFASRRDSACNCDAATDAVQAQIADLRKRAEREPATKPQREKHIALLEKRLQLLGEIRERDQRVAAQLEAFRDAFAFVLDRMSATQFDAAEVVSYMDGLAENVQDTERFVETMAPLTDATLMALDGVGV